LERASVPSEGGCPHGCPHEAGLGGRSPPRSRGLGRPQPLHNPNFPALFSRNKLPSRMYRLTICTLRCPVWFIMLRENSGQYLTKPNSGCWLWSACCDEDGYGVARDLGSFSIPFPRLVLGSELIHSRL
jgi:hypothetical protein